MNKPAAITASAKAVAVTLDGETARLLGEVAERRGTTVEQFAAEAIRRVTKTEADLDAFIRAGEEAIERGEIVSHAEVMAELDRMIAQHRVRCP